MGSSWSPPVPDQDSPSCVPFGGALLPLASPPEGLGMGQSPEAQGLLRGCVQSESCFPFLGSGTRDALMPGSRAKTLHQAWGQGVWALSEVEERLTDPGELVWGLPVETGPKWGNANANTWLPQAQNRGALHGRTVKSMGAGRILLRVFCP